MSIKVSILTVTYNHSKYISQAIESFLMQKTTFPIEILIFDDASTDGTQEIIEEYAKKDDRIITFLMTENQWSKGKYGLVDWLFPSAKGKYIALCEGDDYWTDPYKLQKQVDFLEANPDYVLSATRYKIYDESKEQYSDDWGAKLFNDKIDGINITLDNFFDPWLTKTLTVVFLRSSFNLEIVNKYEYFRDVHLFFHILLQGKGYAHNFFGGIYSLNENGVWGKQSNVYKTKMSMLVYEELYLSHKNINALRDIYLRYLTFYVILLVKNKETNYKELIKCIRKYYITSRSINKTIYLLIRLFYHRIKCIIH